MATAATSVTYWPSHSRISGSAASTAADAHYSFAMSSPSHSAHAMPFSLADTSGSPSSMAAASAAALSYQQLTGSGQAWTAHAIDTPAAQPRISMKRRSPYGGPGASTTSATPRQAKIRIPDLPPIAQLQARTQAMVMDGRRQQAANLPPETDDMSLLKAAADLNCVSLPPVEIGRCFICCQTAEVLPCNFCERETCAHCVHQCAGCHEIYCTFCSTTSYAQHQEKTLCLDCNAAEQRQSALHAAAAAAMGHDSPPRSSWPVTGHGYSGSATMDTSPGHG